MRASGEDQGQAPGRLWNSVAFHTGVLINLAVLLIVGAAGIVSDRRERAALLQQETERLREEAKVLAAAKTQLRDGPVFQHFVDDFCRQMSSAASPGHHIVVFGPEGQARFRAHQRPDRRLERAMTAALHGGASRFLYDKREYLVVGAPADAGVTVAVAQGTGPIERVVRDRRRSRAWSLFIVLLFVFLVSGFVLYVQVRRPLKSLALHARAVAEGRFGVRTSPAGGAEVRILTRGLNDMSRSLEDVQRLRQSEMARAKSIQESLLPPKRFQGRDCSVAAAFIPTQSVGGDLYDILEGEDGSTLLAVLDVSGHGVPAALYTALLRSVLHYEAELHVDLQSIVRKMNQAIFQISHLQDFATCLLVRMWTGADRIQYVRAGHEPAIIIRQDGSHELLETPGLVLGIDAKADYAIGEATLGADSLLYLYTDGLHEVADLSGRMFGRQELLGLFLNQRRLSPELQVRNIVEEVQRFHGTDQFLDDVTLMVVQRTESEGTNLL